MRRNPRLPLALAATRTTHDSAFRTVVRTALQEKLCDPAGSAHGSNSHVAASSHCAGGWDIRSERSKEKLTIPGKLLLHRSCCTPLLLLPPCVAPIRCFHSLNRN